MTGDYLDELRRQLTEMPIQVPPLPWQHLATFAVGGLTHVGYAPNSDLLLVVSSQGRGVIDCLGAKKLARDPEEFFDGLDEVKLTSIGISPLAGETIRIAGLTGGGLPTSTIDGWHLEAVPLPWPRYSVFLSQPWKTVMDGLATTTKVGDEGACEYRAHGFSETGSSFVVALSCEVRVFARTSWKS